jgi:hypothetical protein
MTRVCDIMENQAMKFFVLFCLCITCTDVARGSQESGIQDVARLFGAVPVTGSNLYKLMAAHEAVLLLPGGVREALKPKV